MFESLGLALFHNHLVFIEDILGKLDGSDCVSPDEDFAALLELLGPFSDHYCAVTQFYVHESVCSNERAVIRVARLALNEDVGGCR